MLEIVHFRVRRKAHHRRAASAESQTLGLAGVIDDLARHPVIEKLRGADFLVRVERAAHIAVIEPPFVLEKVPLAVRVVPPESRGPVRFDTGIGRPGSRAGVGKGSAANAGDFVSAPAVAVHGQTVRRSKVHQVAHCQILSG